MFSTDIVTIIIAISALCAHASTVGNRKNWDDHHPEVPTTKSEEEQLSEGLILTCPASETYASRGISTFDWIKERLRRATKELAKEWWIRSAPAEQEHVHLLDENNFNNFRKQHSSSLIMFYATWCYYSQIVRFDFASAASQLQSAHFPGALGAVDCDESPVLCREHQIKTFPTFLHFTPTKEEGEPYTFERTTKEFVSYMIGKDFSARRIPFKIL